MSITLRLRCVTTERSAAAKRTAALLGIVLLLAMPHTAHAAPAADDGRSATASQTPPNTTVGGQAGWLLEVSRRLPATDTEIAAHLSPEALAQIGNAEGFNDGMAELSGSTGLTLLRYQSFSNTSARFLVRSDTGSWIVGIELDANGLIGTLQAIPFLDAPNSWIELRNRLAAVAPQVSMLAARLDERSGECHPVEAISADRARPLGSAFKLYVLGALAEAIGSGRATWDEPLAVRDEWKSPPSGRLQNAPTGTTLPLRSFANLMIAISDNTATDHLIHRLGRDAVERQQARFAMGDPLANTPLLTVRELAELKLADYPNRLLEYLRLQPPERTEYLEDTIARLPLPTDTQLSTWTSPRDIETVEWFASPTDICNAFAGLRRQAETPGLEPVGTALSFNDGGLWLDPQTWPTFWYKGGAEPGVLTLNYLARSSDDQTYVVSMMVSDPNAALPLSTEYELMSLIRGAFTLMTDHGRAEAVRPPAREPLHERATTSQSVHWHP